MEKYNIFNAVAVFRAAENEKETLSKCGLEFANLEYDVIDNSVMQRICEKDITNEAHFIECKTVEDAASLPERPLAYYRLDETGLVKLAGPSAGCLVVYERVTTGFADITKGAVGIELCAKVRAANRNILLADDIYPDGIIWSQQILKAYNEKYGENILDKLALLFVSAKGSVRFRGRYYKLLNDLAYQNFLEPLKTVTSNKGLQLYATIEDRLTLSLDLPCNINLAGYGCFDRMFLDVQNAIPSHLTFKRYLSFSRFCGFNGVALVSDTLILQNDLNKIKGFVDNLYAEGIDLILIGIPQNRDELYNAKAEYIKKYCDLVAATCSQMSSQTRLLVYYPNFTRFITDDNRFDAYFAGEVKKLDQNGIAYDICDELTFRTLLECNEGKITVGERQYDSIILVGTENINFVSANKIQEFLQQKIAFYACGEKLRLIDGVKSARVEVLNKQITALKRIDDVAANKPLRLSAFAPYRVGFLPDKSSLVFVGSTNANLRFKAGGTLSAIDVLTRSEKQIYNEKTGKMFAKKAIIIKNLPTSSPFIRLSKGKKKLYKNGADMAVQTGEMFSIKSYGRNILTLDKCTYRTTRGQWNDVTLLSELGVVLSTAKSGAEFKFTVNCEELTGNIGVYVPDFSDVAVSVNGKAAPKENALFNVSGLLKAGYNDLVVAVPKVASQITDNGMIESIYVTGEFVATAEGDVTYDTDKKIYLDGDFVLTDLPEQIDINKIRESGFWNFAGVMELSCNAFVSRRGVSVYKLKFNGMNAEFVEVAINGISVGAVGFEPYEINVSDYLEDGDNEITLKLYSSDEALKNRTTENGVRVFEPFGLGVNRINCEFVEFVNVEKTYKSGENIIRALDKVNLNAGYGEFVVISGPSGSGKTTLLNLLGGMDTKFGGKVVVDGINIGSLREKKLTKYRKNEVGFIFQYNNFIEDLTVRENIELASDLCKNAISTDIALAAVDLADHADSFVSRLSPGERHRVAIARSLAKNPKLLLCDEPTGMLSASESKEIISLLYETCKATGKTAFVVTNNSEVYEIADRVIRLKNGCVVENTVNLE